jgi:hypothetical protein
MDSNPPESNPNPKRKRRSPQKNAQNDLPQAESSDIKPDFEMKSESEHFGYPENSTEEAHENSGEEKQKRRWFDIVMGSNQEESSEEEGLMNRRYVT